MALRRVDFSIGSGGCVGSLCGSRSEVTWLKIWEAAAKCSITSIFFVLSGVLPSVMASLTSETKDNQGFTCKNIYTKDSCYSLQCLI